MTKPTQPARTTRTGTIVGAATIAVAALLASPIAQADGASDAHGRELSPYEQSAVTEALADSGGTIDEAPEGKIIERVEVFPRDVIEDRDPLPNFLNVFHTRSKRHVIERQVLLGAGDVYRQSLVDESARNLRGLRQLSLVLIVPVAGRRPDRVRLLVITKDVWSLRVNSDFRFAEGKLQRLLIQPSEENFFGVHHVASTQFTLDPASYSLGGRYELPRIGGSWLLARVSANVIVNRESGDTEGSYGSFAYGQPLYSTQARWAWSATVGWRDEVTRRFLGSHVAAFDALATPGDDVIPFRYRSDLLAGGYQVTRSFGAGTKHDVTLAMEASRSAYRPIDLAAYDREAVAEFVTTELPTSDMRIGPAVQYHTYSTTFLRTIDLETLGLQEDFRVGHDAYVKVYPVLEALASTHDILGVYAAGSYTVALGDGLARALAEATTETDGDTIPDGSVRLGLRVVTPSTRLGRVVYDGQVLSRYANQLNVKSSLGGDTRLRGYATQQFLGKDLVTQTLELRTRALQIWSVQLGGAAFFESGDAFDGFDQLELKQSAGFGIRGLLPMFNRIVFRADWGFPLTPGFIPPGSFPGDIVITFRQAFPMPVVPFQTTDPY